MDIKRNIKAAQNQLGIDKLRKHQVKPINNLLDGNDTLVIAPTSAGKSAIYQVPGLILPELTVVIEPTLSLIYDQVNKMQSLGIQVEYVDSSQNQFDRMSLQKLLEKQKIEFLFITPDPHKFPINAIMCYILNPAILIVIHLAGLYISCLQDIYIQGLTIAVHLICAASGR